MDQQKGIDLAVEGLSQLAGGRQFCLEPVMRNWKKPRGEASAISV
jgi:hypothetical protein